MISLDYRDPRPIYEQIVERITELAITGVLPPHEKLPSVRQLAMELSINPNTIQRSYQILEQNGVIYSQKGRGSFVSESFESLRQERERDILRQIKKLAVDALRLNMEREKLVDQIEQVYNTGGVLHD